MVKDIMTTPEGQSTERTPNSMLTSSEKPDEYQTGRKVSPERVDVVHASGQIFLEANESKYIGTSHWAAILENVGAWSVDAYTVNRR